MHFSCRSIVAIVVVLAGCTSAAPRTAKFSPGSGEGLLTFALASETPGTISLTVARYDAESNRVTANSFSGQYFVEHTGVKPAHYFIQVPPGKYVIKHVSVQVYPNTTMVCLSQGTIAFDAAAGKILYLGQFVFDGHGIRKIGNNLEAAQAAMKMYPNVDGNVESAVVTQVTFANSSRLGREICGG